ncbi:MAG: hypothetical protein HZB68_03545 [Candidatus Aenigmarchaeota archaeon]|nr:hypothetical protein [Candidatus Aenigmarchaeota archaeon]
MMKGCMHMGGKLLDVNDNLKCFKCGFPLGKVSESELRVRGLTHASFA